MWVMTNRFNLKLHLCFAIVLVLSGNSIALAARLNAVIDLSSQTLSVRLDGNRLYVWNTSTARKGYRTPIGTFSPKRLERIWYSTKYENSPMPYSIFFHGGYAIHGTTDLKNLGRPASHGCVRLHPDNARILFDLVRKVGMRESRIIVRK